MIHITSTHYQDPYWIKIQLDSIKKHIKVPYKTYMAHAAMPEMYESFESEVDFLYQHTMKKGSKFHNMDGTRYCVPHIKKNMGPGDIVIKIDSDAFFINDIDEKYVKFVNDNKFIAMKEPLHEADTTLHTPHPAYYAFTSKFLNDGLTDALTKLQPRNSNWWGGVISWLSHHKIEWKPMTRSNEVNLHPIYFGLYGDLIYHHWAGSRHMITRFDRANATKCGLHIDDVEKENQKLSKVAKDEIQLDVDTFINKLR